MESENNRIKRFLRKRYGVLQLGRNKTLSNAAAALGTNLPEMQWQHETIGATVRANRVQHSMWHDPKTWGNDFLPPLPSLEP